MSSNNFQELNLSDSFLFPAALEDPITCRLILECIVEEPISELFVRAEYTKQFNSEFKCIRLDVYAKDVITEVSYNLEMQNNNEYNLPLRSRYYQAQIDVGNLKSGAEYKDLKPLYVIFICNFDPFGRELYRYTFSMQCEEANIPLNDGVKRIFLSTKGKNKDEVPPILIDFLGYLNDSTDSYVERHFSKKVKEIHGRIVELKKNRDVEKRYMHYLSVDKIIKAKEKEAEEAKQKADEAKQKADEAKQKADAAEKKADEAEKKADEVTRKSQEIFREILFETIGKLGEISKEVREHIKEEKDIDILNSMYKAAVKSGSIEQFEEQIANL